jgi:hypothetical protein
MTGARRSARLSGQSPSPDPSCDVTSVHAGSKHKAQDTEESPNIKKGRNTKDKKKQILEESIPDVEHENASKDTEMKEVVKGSVDEKHVDPGKDSTLKEPATDSRATKGKASKLKRE